MELWLDQENVRLKAENARLKGELEKLEQNRTAAVALRDLELKHLKEQAALAGNVLQRKHEECARLKGELEAVKSADSSGRWMAVEKLTSERDALRERLEKAVYVLRRAKDYGETVGVSLFLAKEAPHE